MVNFSYNNPSYVYYRAGVGNRIIEEKLGIVPQEYASIVIKAYIHSNIT